MSNSKNRGGSADRTISLDELDWHQPVFLQGGIYHVIQEVGMCQSLKTICRPLTYQDCDTDGLRGMDTDEGVVSVRHAEESHNALPCKDCFRFDWNDVRSLPKVADAKYFLRQYFDGKTQDVAKSVKVKEVGNQCEMCGSSGRLELHHIVPVRSGGTHDQWNTLLLCPQCHGSAESYLSDIFDTHIPGGEFLRLKDVVDGKRDKLRDEGNADGDD